MARVASDWPLELDKKEGRNVPAIEQNGLIRVEAKLERGGMKTGTGMGSGRRSCLRSTFNLAQLCADNERHAFFPFS